MRTTNWVILSLGLWSTVAFAGNPKIHPSGKRIPGQYIVVLESGADVNDVSGAVKQRGRGHVRKQYERALKALAVDMSEADAQELARDPRVAYVEEDSVIETTAVPWGPDRIDQRNLPLNGTFNPGHNGNNIRAYIFDTGVSPHDEFGARLLPGFNATGDALGTKDCNGHGTHVASILGGKNYGVAEGTKIVPVRVLGCDGQGSLSALLAGIEWAINDKIAMGKQAVANMSLSGYASSALDYAVNRLIDAGVTTVVAAGNQGYNACDYSPARVRRALTVAATSNSDNQALWSNYGGCVDIFAPGVDILGAWPTTSKSTNTLSGTSQAAPFVAGVATLWLEGTTGLTPATIVNDILSHATVNVVTGLSDAATPNRLVSVFRADSEIVTSVEQLIADSGFAEGDAFWDTKLCTVINSTGCGPSMMSVASLPSHSGNTHASLGGTDSKVQLVSAPLTLPVDASSAELSFWLWVFTADRGSTVRDRFTVEIWDEAGNMLQTLGTFSNFDQSVTYKRSYFDMSAYRGKTIRVAFTSFHDQGLATWFLLDDVEVNAYH